MKYKNHPSILRINDKMETDSSFKCHAISDEDMYVCMYILGKTSLHGIEIFTEEIIKKYIHKK